MLLLPPATTNSAAPKERTSPLRAHLGKTMSLKEDSVGKDPVFLELPNSIRNISKQGHLIKHSNTHPVSYGGGGEQDFNYSRVIPYVPEQASDKEKRIHNFLNSMQAYAINVKEMIDDFSKTPTSNRLMKEFSKTKKNSSLFARRK